MNLLLNSIRVNFVFCLIVYGIFALLSSTLDPSLWTWYMKTLWEMLTGLLILISTVLYFVVRE